jgi:ElaB/YqjD/DUF883 family membrane-anchored ribosome-binding protein
MNRISEMEELMMTAADRATEAFAPISEKLGEGLDATMETLERVGTAVKENTLEAKECTEGYVRAHPWKAMGYAAGIGFVLGWLLTRR